MAQSTLFYFHGLDWYSAMRIKFFVQGRNTETHVRPSNKTCFVYCECLGRRHHTSVVQSD